MKKRLFYSYLYSPPKSGYYVIQGCSVLELRARAMLVVVGSSENNIIMNLYNNTFIKKHTTCSLRAGTKSNKRQYFYLIINLVH